MNSNDIRQCRRFIMSLQALIRDANGGLGYRQYADKVIEDISGLTKFTTKILASSNPLLAAQRIMTHPASKDLARIFYDPSCQRTYQALNDLVVCYYQAAQLALKPKRERTDRDIRAWKYLRKLYRNGVDTIRENYGYNRSAKKMYKEQFSDLRNYTRGSTHSSLLFNLDSDDDEDFDDDDEETDDNLMIPRSLIGESGASGVLSQKDLELLRRFQGEDDDDDEDDLPIAPTRSSRNLSDLSSLRDIDYDFSGKATLELIADRLATVTEGMQLILNRIYGQSVTIPTEDEEPAADDGDDSDTEDILHEGMLRSVPQDVRDGSSKDRAGIRRLLQGDFSDLSRSECIKLFNTLGNELAQTAEAIATVAPAQAASSEAAIEEENEPETTDDAVDPPVDDPVVEEGEDHIPNESDLVDLPTDEPEEEIPDDEEEEEPDEAPPEQEAAIIKALRTDDTPSDDTAEQDDSGDETVDPELPTADESAADAFNRLVAPPDDTE